MRFGKSPAKGLSSVAAYAAVVDILGGEEAPARPPDGPISSTRFFSHEVLLFKSKLWCGCSRLAHDHLGYVPKVVSGGANLVLLVGFAKDQLVMPPPERIIAHRSGLQTDLIFGFFGLIASAAIVSPPI